MGVLILGAFATDAMVSSLSVWRAGVWILLAFAGGVVGGRLVLARLTGRVAELFLFPGVADLSPRNPVEVRRSLASHRLEAEELLATDDRGGLSLLRDDVWALHVRSGMRRVDQVLGVERSLLRTAAAGPRDELTVGADLLDCRSTARGWARGSVRVDAAGVRWVPGWSRGTWVGVGVDGAVFRGRPRGSTQQFSPPQVEVLELGGAGDSAGLALFLAYVADILGVREDERFAVAASGDIAGAVFRPVSGTAEKVEAAALGGACAVFLPLAQPVGVSELSDVPGLVLVGDTVAAARAFLEVRAGLEAAGVTAN